MTISLNDFIAQVADMRSKQEEHAKARAEKNWQKASILFGEARSLEQNVDRMIKIHQEMEEGRESFLSDDHA